MAVVGISRKHTVRNRHADLLAKFVLLARVALRDAHYFRLVHAVNLLPIQPLFLVDPFAERKKPGEPLGAPCRPTARIPGPGFVRSFRVLALDSLICRTWA
jgi:hypothetical protein